MPAYLPFTGVSLPMDIIDAEKEERPQFENCNLLFNKTSLYNKRKMERQELLEDEGKK